MRHPPLQPPLLWHIYLLFWVLGILGSAWALPAAFSALILLCLEVRLRRAPRILFGILLFLAGLGMATAKLAPPGDVPGWARDLTASAQDNRQNESPRRLCGHVEDAQGLADSRLRVILSHVRPEGAPLSESLPGLTLWTWANPTSRPLPGQDVCLNQRPQPVRGTSNEDLADSSTGWRARGVFWTLWSRGERGGPAVFGGPSSSADLRERLRLAFMHALDRAPTSMAQSFLSQGRAILPALIFGDKSGIDHRTQKLFSAATLAHSLALSGQHLAIAGLLGLFCVWLARKCCPDLYLRRPRALLALAASCPPALLYLWIGNAPPSLIRAACMLLFLTFFLLRDAPRATPDILAPALCCITALHPMAALDTGLQLSALCVGVIGLALPAMRRLLPAAEAFPVFIIGKAVRTGLQILFISLCIQAALLPLNVLLFGNAGFWFVLNLVWLPVLGLFILPGAALGLIAASAGLDASASAILTLSALPCDLFIALLDLLDTAGLLQPPLLPRPHWTALPAFACLIPATALYLSGAATKGARQTARRLVLAGVLLLCVGPALFLIGRMDRATECRILDVGQGQAVLLRLPGHERILIDGGGSHSPRFDTGEAIVGPAVARNDLPRLDIVVSSHPDLDHTGGLPYVLKNCAVSSLWHNGREAEGPLKTAWAAALARHEARIPAAGESLAPCSAVPGLRLEVLHPPAPDNAAQSLVQWANNAQQWKGNDASLVLRLSLNGHGLALITGDAGRAALTHILHQGLAVQADVLIAPHHGSDKNFLPAFIDAVRPALVVASCGFRNRWGFPGRSLRSWLRARGIPLLTTAEEGEIILRWDAETGFSVHGDRHGPILPDAGVVSNR